ncbi:glycoside hydrolase family 24 protein [Burkholderia glumae]
MARITADQAGGKNVLAFLDMTRFSEIGPWLIANSDEGYNIIVGSHGPITRGGETIPARLNLFRRYDTHPNVYDAQTNSTAAGGFQLLAKYFAPYAKQLHLADFSPVSQELIAIQQINERHAIKLIQAGQLAAAIHACGTIWASFPGSPYGQHTNTFESLCAAYKAAGGTLAV